MEKMFSVKELGEILNLQAQTIYKKIKAGELPVIRLNSRVIRVKESVLKRYLATKGRQS